MTHTLNHRLAELLGWTNIIETGGALLGTPPAGEPQCRGQAKVPDWEGDWRDCGPLMVEHDCSPLDFIGTFCAGSYADLGGTPIVRHWAEVRIDAHPAKDAAARHAIVAAVIAKLEAGQ